MLVSPFFDIILNSKYLRFDKKLSEVGLSSMTSSIRNTGAGENDSNPGEMGNYSYDEGDKVCLPVVGVSIGTSSKYAT